MKNEKVSGSGAVELQAEEGTRELKISLGGFRTNAVTLNIREDGRHRVRVVPTPLEVFLRVPIFGLLGVVLLAAVPGAAYRLQAA